MIDIKDIFYFGCGKCHRKWNW